MVRGYYDFFSNLMLFERRITVVFVATNGGNNTRVSTTWENLESQGMSGNLFLDLENQGKSGNFVDGQGKFFTIPNHKTMYSSCTTCYGI